MIERSVFSFSLDIFSLIRDGYGVYDLVTSASTSSMTGLVPSIFTVMPLPGKLFSFLAETKYSLGLSIDTRPFSCIFIKPISPVAP